MWWGLLGMGSVWAGPPVAPDVRFVFEPPDTATSAAGDRTFTGTGCVEASSFHPDAGGAWDCDGQPTQGYELTVGPALSFDGALTISAWVRTAAPCGDVGVRCAIATQGHTGGGVGTPYGFMFYTRNGNLALEMQFDAGTAEQLVEGGAVAVDVWSWVVARYTPGTVDLFIDGALVHSGPTLTNDHLGSGLSLGFMPERDYDYHGLVDELMVFDRALDDTEIDALWAWYDDGDGDGLIMDADCDPVVPEPCHTGTTGDTAAPFDTASTPATDTGVPGDTATTGSGGSDGPPGASGGTGAPANSVDIGAGGTSTTDPTGPTPTTGEPRTPTAFDTTSPSTAVSVGLTAAPGCRCTAGAGPPLGGLGLAAGLLLVRRRRYFL